jgi:hypothetical protein
VDAAYGVGRTRVDLSLEAALLDAPPGQRVFAEEGAGEPHHSSPGQLGIHPSAILLTLTDHDGGLTQGKGFMLSKLA